MSCKRILIGSSTFPFFCFFMAFSSSPINTKDVGNLGEWREWSENGMDISEVPRGRCRTRVV